MKNLFINYKYVICFFIIFAFTIFVYNPSVSAAIGGNPDVTINQAVGQNDPQMNIASPKLTYTIVFDEPITDATFGVDDFVVTGTGAATAGWTIDSLTKVDSVTWTLKINPVGYGTYIVDIPADKLTKTVGGNFFFNHPSTSTDNTITFTDGDIPVLIIDQCATQADPTATNPVCFMFVASEPVNWGTQALFVNSWFGTAGGSITLQTTIDSTHKKVDFTATSDGLISIKALTVRDLSGNLSLPATSTDNLVRFEKDVPSVVINQVGTQVDPTGVSQIKYAINFSEDIDPTTFTTSDLKLTGTGATGATLGTLTTTNNKNWTVLVNAVNEGTYILSMDAAMIKDTAAKDNTASTSTDNTVTYIIPKIIVSKTALTMGENGGTGTFTAKLNVAPVSDVQVAVTSSSVADGTVAPALLTFTKTNWDTEQTVTVTGVNDNVVNNPNDTANIVLSVVDANSDDQYDAATDSTVVATFTNDDIDTDHDGIIDALDTDIDGDGIPNATDSDIDGDGIANVFDTDIDGDGIPNATDTDDDGDGTPDATDTTPSGTGSATDIDGDGIPNDQDTDMDGDGILNAVDNDIDGDGIPNATDTDDDGDGTPDATDTTPNGTGTATDIDGDGIPNADDTDMDGDGIPNALDTDIDGDGIPNATDTDDDGDGTPDATDTTPSGNGTATDFDADGIPNTEEDAAPNSGDGNGDGIKDSLQTSVVSKKNSITNGNLTMVVSENCTYVKGLTINKEADLTKLDATYDYPLGIFGFQLKCQTPGQTATVEFYFDKVYDTTNWKWRKFDNTSYFDLTNFISFSTKSVKGTNVTVGKISITDGGLGDQDKAANGTITDPSGPAMLTPTLANTGSSYNIQFIIAMLSFGVLIIVKLRNLKGKMNS